MLPFLGHPVWGLLLRERKGREKKESDLTGSEKGKTMEEKGGKFCAFESLKTSAVPE